MDPLLFTLATPSAAGATPPTPSSHATTSSSAPTASSASAPPWIDPVVIASVFHATVPLALLIPGAPGPLLVNAPRNSYLPALLSTIPYVASVLIPPALSQSPSATPTTHDAADSCGQLAFVCAESKAVLKWYYPIGVLFDVHRPTPPPLEASSLDTSSLPVVGGTSGGGGASDRGSSSGDDEYAHIESPNNPAPGALPLSEPAADVDDAQIKSLASTPWRIHVLLKCPPPALDLFSGLLPSPLVPDPDLDRSLSPAALDTLVPYVSLDNLAAMYRNEVKQAEYIKYGSSKKTNAIGKADSELLWDAVVNNNLTNAEPLMTTLFHADPISRAWPIRIHIRPALKSTGDTRPYLQPLVPVTSLVLDTVGQVVHARLGLGDQQVAVVVQGLRVAADTPLAWVHRHLVCVDGWMYFVVVPARKKVEEAGVGKADTVRVEEKDDTDLVLVDP